MQGRLIVVALALLALPGVTLAQSNSSKTVRLTVAPQSNEARYVVREQLLGVDLPNEAIGKTTRVTGNIVVASDGTILKDSSRFTIDLASLTSDRDMRDNYLRRRTLQTDQYATAVFTPAAFKHLRWPLRRSGDVSFQLAGDLTVRGVTRPVTWDITATAVNASLKGNAKTRFTFADFGLEKPRVRSVLSVEDEIRLEYAFFLVPAN